MRKLTPLLMLLLTSFIYSSAWASEFHINFGYQYGTFYKKGKQANYPGSTFDGSIAGATNQYCNKWVSTDGIITMQYGIGDDSDTENNFELNTTSFCYGTSSHVINISVADGYTLKGYVIKGTSQSTSTDITITPAEGGTATTFTNAESRTLTVSGLSTTSTSFTLSAASNKYVSVEEFYFIVKPVKTVEWYTANPFSPNDNANVYYVGITTPGTTSNTYTMTAFSFYENSGNGAASRYTAICKSAPSAASSWKIAESEVLAISNENTTPTAEGYIDYTLNEGIELAGGTTYYMVFLTSNTATDGSYTVGTQRIRLKNNSSYPPSVCLGNGAVRTDLIPGFKATLFTDALYSVNYTCKSTIDGSDITSGTFSDVMGTITAPTLDGYVFSHATTESGDAFDMTQAVTTDLNLYLYYAPLYNVTYNVYYGGNLTKSGQGLTAHGSTPSLPDELKDPYLTYTYDVDEITAATTEVNATATWNGPFEISTEGNETWYMIRTKANHVMYVSGGNVPAYTGLSTRNKNTRFAIYGSYQDGFKINVSSA